MDTARVTYEEDCNALRPFIGDELPIIIERLRQQGYVVTPKERVQRLHVSRAVSYDVLAEAGKSKIAHMLQESVERGQMYDIAHALSTSPAVLRKSYQRGTLEHVFTAEVRVIIPKPEEPADG